MHTYAVHNFAGERLTQRFASYDTTIMLAREWAKHLCINVRVFRNEKPLLIVGPMGVVKTSTTLMRG